jgi:hypothetical protein
MFLPCTNQSKSKALHRESAGEVTCPIGQLRLSRDRSLIFTGTPYASSRNPGTNWLCSLGYWRKVIGRPETLQDVLVQLTLAHIYHGGFEFPTAYAL